MFNIQDNRIFNLAVLFLILQFAFVGATEVFALNAKESSVSSFSLTRNHNQLNRDRIEMQGDLAISKSVLDSPKNFVVKIESDNNDKLLDSAFNFYSCNSEICKAKKVLANGEKYYFSLYRENDSIKFLVKGVRLNLKHFNQNVTNIKASICNVDENSCNYASLRAPNGRANGVLTHYSFQE